MGGGRRLSTHSDVAVHFMLWMSKVGLIFSVEFLSSLIFDAHLKVLCWEHDNCFGGFGLNKVIPVTIIYIYVQGTRMKKMFVCVLISARMAGQLASHSAVAKKFNVWLFGKYRCDKC